MLVCIIQNIDIVFEVIIIYKFIEIMIKIIDNIYVYKYLNTNSCYYSRNLITMFRNSSSFYFYFNILNILITIYIILLYSFLLYLRGFTSDTSSTPMIFTCYYGSSVNLGRFFITGPFNITCIITLCEVVDYECFLGFIQIIISFLH